MATIEIRDILDKDTGKTIFPRTHVDAVIGLKDFSFFEAVTDPSDNTRQFVQLKPQYTGLSIPGWSAVGGVGQNGGGGGGGLVETVLTWSDLQNMRNAPADDYTTVFNARSLYEVYRSGLLSISSRQDGSLDFNFRNGDVISVDLNHTHPDYEQDIATLQAAVAAIHSLELVVVAALPTASADTEGKIYLVPSADPQAQNVKDEFITIRSGSEGAYTYSWEQIGSTAIDLTGYATESWVQQQGYALAVNVPTESTITGWGFTKNTGTITGITMNGASKGTSGVVDLGTVVTTETDPTVPSWAKAQNLAFASLPGLYSLGTQITASAVAGNMLGVSVLSANLSTSSADLSRVEWDGQNNAWHFYGNAYFDGWTAVGGIGTGGSGYGVEQITSQADGTVDFHFSGGDIVTVDLNHEHPSYPKYTLCTQAQYDAITTKDSGTLYLIPITT